MGCGDSGDPAGTLVAGWVVMRSADAPPAVTFTGFDVTAVRTPSLNCSVRIPDVPVIVRFPKVATPAASVVAVVTPPNVPPPLPMVAVAVWPPRLTGFRKPSVRRTAGAGVSVAPLGDNAGGCVDMIHRVAGPAVAEATNRMGLPASPADETSSESEFGPALVPSPQPDTVAIPLASVETVTTLRNPPIWPPLRGVNATATPATGLPEASVTFTDGTTATCASTVAV